MTESNSSPNINEKPNEQTSYGFELYPERRSGKAERGWLDRLMSPVSDYDYCKVVCEMNVMEVMKKNPLIKILLGALKNAGCPVDIKRHIVCESCNSEVQGGYDSEFNQVVLCHNVRKARNHPEVVLLHELIHMYDYCVNEMDFKNLSHLACTEIRAASLVHCSLLSSILLGHASIFEWKKKHQDCVKMRATKSLMVARQLDMETALSYVWKVFDKCYKDLEPVGRRVRRNSNEQKMAYEEAKCFEIVNELLQRSPHWKLNWKAS